MAAAHYRDALERADRTPATIAKHLAAIRGLAGRLLTHAPSAVALACPARLRRARRDHRTARAVHRARRWPSGRSERRRPHRRPQRSPTWPEIAQIQHAWAAAGL